MKQFVLLTTLFCSLSLNAQFEFGPFNSIEGGVGVEQIILVDFDSDGDIDLLSRSSSNVDWHENLGLGFFLVFQNITFTYETLDFEVSDFDQDGNMDLLVSLDYFEGVIFCENLDDEVFDDDFVHLDLVSGWGPIAVTDLDFDGDFDLSCAQGDNITSYENGGSGIIIGSEDLLELGYEQFTDNEQGNPLYTAKMVVE